MVLKSIANGTLLFPNSKKMVGNVELNERTKRSVRMFDPGSHCTAKLEREFVYILLSLYQHQLPVRDMQLDDLDIWMLQLYVNKSS